VFTYGHLIPGANVSFVDRLDVDEKDREGPQQNATQAQPALERETAIPSELLTADATPLPQQTATLDL